MSRNNKGNLFDYSMITEEKVIKDDYFITDKLIYLDDSFYYLNDNYCRIEYNPLRIYRDIPKYGIVNEL